MKNKIIGVCPNCGKPVVEREKGWFCENRECRFVLWKDNAFFKRLGKRLDAPCGGQAAAGWSCPPEGLQECQGQDLQCHRAAVL